MLNNLKKVRDTVSEKTKLLIYLVVASLVFIIACILPLAFKGDRLISPDFKTGERAAMFVRYNSSDTSVRYKVITEPDSSLEKLCQSRFDEIVSGCMIDSSSRSTLTEGSQYVTLTDGENTMQLCRMWLQDEGDWTNWIDVYMDAETGFIYYIYLSSICVNNIANYTDAIEGELSAKTLASSIAKETGYDLKVVNWSGKTEDSATAYTVKNGDALVWTIYCSYHPAFMLDIKISVS